MRLSNSLCLLPDTANYMSSLIVLIILNLVHGSGAVTIDKKDGRNMKFRISKIASTFTAEALTIGETL
jgi:hypothetical protein